MLIVYLYTVDWIRKADYRADVYIKIKTILVSEIHTSITSVNVALLDSRTYMYVYARMHA